MDELRALKEQNTSCLPAESWVKSGVFPFFFSLFLHLSVAGGASFVLHAAYEKSGGGHTATDKPVYVTLVQEISENANIPEVSEPVQASKPKPKEPPKIKHDKQEIIAQIEQETAPLPQKNIEKSNEKNQDKSPVDKRIRRTDKVKSLTMLSAKAAPLSSGSSHSQTFYYGGLGSAEVKYRDQVRAAINANRIYPRQARRLKMEGKAIMRLEVLRDGKILSSQFIKSTGHHVLDQAAQEMISSSDPLPSVPIFIKKLPVIIDIPLEFKLQK